MSAHAQLGAASTVAQATVAFHHDVPARMRDGVVLRANVYRPVGLGTWPTLVARTPYGKDLPGASSWLDPVRAARDGFMVVVQDTRGRFASDGEWEPFQFEGDDGYDTVEWAARLPGSNGRVGMFGLSYWGNTQWLAALAQPPSLFAIAPGMTWSEPNDGGFARGGALELGLTLVWALEQGIDHLQRRAEPRHEICRRVNALTDELDGLAEGGFWELPVNDLPLLRRHQVPELGSIRALSDPTFASPCRVAGSHDQVQVPVFGIGGWHDGFLQGVIDNHAAMTALGRDSRLVIGPWSHANHSDVVGGLSFGLQARKDGGPAGGPGDVDERQLAWFRGQLTPEAEPERSNAPVRFFVMGANRWREVSSWPPGGTDQRWYLRSGGRLTRTNPEPDEARSDFTYDPADPVPTVGGQTLISPGWAAGPVDQAEVEGRHDVLVFSSAPLGRDLEVTGRVRVVLYAESSATSTDWVARLCDVHPDGRSFNLCDGILRVRDGARECRRYELDLWSTSNVFRRHHRLRVQVTSSCFPRWDRNLGTGNQRAANHQVAHQRIHHDAVHRSWVELPVVD
ncbi:MAG: CocE/NonD family hydrolase [Solirubrobacteraceae bacterium]